MVKAVIENIQYSVVKSGQIAGSVTMIQMPDIPCRAVAFTAVASNDGNVYIGGFGVTRPDTITDTTTGLELQPGDMLQFIPVVNLDIFYYISENAGDDITYLAVE